MMGFLIVIHAIISVGLIAIILMQSGRGGGLTESFAAGESLFGANTSAFLIKATTVFAGIFLVTSLSLAFLSAKRDKSLMGNTVAAPTKSVFPITTKGSPSEVLPTETK